MKLSVCIVAYNHAQFIEQCITSALLQNVSFDYEIVVGEDCSTDGSRAILERLQAAHPTILKVRFRPENLGAERNFETTIAECAGDYIAFLEGDNYWTHTDKLQQQVDFLEANGGTSFCFHRTQYVTSGGRATDVVMPPDDPNSISSIEYLIQESNPVALCSVVARARHLAGMSEWLGGLKLGDWPLVLMLGTRGQTGYIAQTMAAQRQHAGGAWSVLSPQVQVLYVVQMLNRVAPLLEGQHRRLLEERKATLLTWMADQLVSEPTLSMPQFLNALVALNDSVVSNSLLPGLRDTARHEIAGLQESQQQAINDKNVAIARMTDLEMQLARARGRPLKVLRDYLRFRLLSFLSRQTWILPTRMALRFGQSAYKRRPTRSTSEWRGVEDGLQIAPQQTDTDKMQKDGSFVFAGKVKPDAKKPTILVVTHEASRTGAPILALNLVQGLAERYNVVALSLRGGDLLDNFRAASISTVVADHFHHDPSHFTALIQGLCKTHQFDFAVVNSLESRGVLKPLNLNKVPIVTLVHEFASYTNPKTAFMDVFNWSTEAVFSTNVTLENALQENNLTTAPNIHVAAQGKCIVPVSDTAEAKRDTERAWLRNKLRPPVVSDGAFVVIGAGAIQIRKGVDLFLECATRVLQSPGGEKFRFAWIGHGYDPDRDMGYSVYLRDQLRRAGIEDRVQFLRETSEIELAYELADLFLLPSRLDPLPNVAIDALSVGLPVMCFDRTTGIADFLTGAGLGPTCVAAYIDTHELSAKMLALAGSRPLYDSVSEQCRDLARASFDMADYVATIEKIAQDGVRKRRG